MTTTPAMPEPFAWAWHNKATGAKGVYFEDPKSFGITSHPEYEWTNLYTEAQFLALRPQAAPMTGDVFGVLKKVHETAVYVGDGECSIAMDLVREIDAIFERSIAHHGITAHVGGEGQA